MKVTYLFSSPGGDRVLVPEDLSNPFLITPKKKHSTLKLGQYFSSIEHLILRDNGRPLDTILATHYPECASLAKVKEVAITSQKHGAFYHIASVNLITENATCTLAVTAALTKNSRTGLKKEFGRLEYLHKKINLPYLPEVYFFAQEKIHTSAGDKSIAFVLGQWFSGFHEWHLSVDETGRATKIRLWDTDNGNRFLSANEAEELIRQVAKILTLYYDPRTFQQIVPWHHAAGDFIAKSVDGTIDVRLITVRGYEPLSGFSSGEEGGLEIPLVVFFLNLGIRIRLDRMDGVGVPVWMGEFALQAAISGFLEGLSIHEENKRLYKGFVKDFHALLKTFNENDFYEILQHTVTGNGHEDPEEMKLLKDELTTHCRQLRLELERIQ